MLPIRDENPRRAFPYVNIAFLILNVLVFAYQLTLSERQLTRFFFDYALIPLRVTQALSLPVALTFFTSMFMHGDFFHIMGNMLYLYIFGDNVEDVLGHVRYALVYLVCGIGAALTHIAVGPTSAIPTLGASGAIAGVLGAYLIFFPRARVQYLLVIGFFIRFIELPAMIALGLWFAMQFLSALLSWGSEGGGIAFFAHIGGFVFGLAAGFLCRRMGCRRRLLSTPFYDTEYQAVYYPQRDNQRYR